MNFVDFNRILFFFLEEDSKIFQEKLLSIYDYKRPSIENIKTIEEILKKHLVDSIKSQVRWDHASWQKINKSISPYIIIELNWLNFKEY